MLRLTPMAFGPGGDWTIFCQGDPFYHSPEFVRLLDHRNLWRDIQPLTDGYNRDLPPPFLRGLETDEWIAGIPIRTELMSAATMRMSAWRDDSGEEYTREYAEVYGLPLGWSISGHFFETCGLSGMAEQAWRATLIRGVYAAIFAVRNDRLAVIPAKRIPRMRKLACGHSCHGYMYERLWLHLFGLPFITLGQMEEAPQAKKLEVVS